MINHVVNIEYGIFMSENYIYLHNNSGLISNQF